MNVIESNRCSWKNQVLWMLRWRIPFQIVRSQ